MSLETIVIVTPPVEVVLEGAGSEVLVLRVSHEETIVIVDEQDTETVNA